MPTGHEQPAPSEQPTDVGQPLVQHNEPPSAINPVEEILSLRERVQSSTYSDSFDTPEANALNREHELGLVEELIQRRLRRAASQPPSTPQENH